MAERMSGTKTATPRSRQRFHQCLRQQFRQLDMRDWLVWPSPWLDAAREVAIAAGREHREPFTCERSVHVPHLPVHYTARPAIPAELASLPR